MSFYRHFRPPLIYFSSVLDLISYRNIPVTSTNSQSEYSQTASPSPPADQHTPLTSSANGRPSLSTPLTVYVQITLGFNTLPKLAPVVHLARNSVQNPQSIHLSALSGASIVFISPAALSLQSKFTVYKNGSNIPIHTEVVPMTFISSPRQRSGWLFRSQILPAFWTRWFSSQSKHSFIFIQASIAELSI